MDKKEEKIPTPKTTPSAVDKPAKKTIPSVGGGPAPKTSRPATVGGPNKVVETYAEDMARVIEDDQGGLIRKIIQEQSEKEQEKKNLSPQSRKNKFFMFSGVVLLLIALFTFSFFILKDDIYTVPIEKQFTPLIFNDKSFFIEIENLPKDKIVTSILTEISETDLKDGGLEGIYLTKNKQVLGIRHFINILEGRLILPGRVFVNDNFLIGLVNGETRDFFMLIKMRSFIDIFDSVKAWENKMLSDLHALLEIPINANTSYLFTKNFEDGIVENKNARILYDKEGKIVLMYVFADETSVVWANKIDAVREVMFRLSSSQIKK